MAASNNTAFPEFVTKLPKANYAAEDVHGLEGWVLQGDNQQIVFNQNAGAMAFHPHRHAESWGIVLNGWCELVIEDVPTRFEKGDVYRVPEGVLHFARQSEDYQDVVIFNEPGRVPIAED